MPSIPLRRHLGFARRYLREAVRQRGRDLLCPIAPAPHRPDPATLRLLPTQVRVVVQPGNRDLVRRFRRVDELAWGESTEVGGVSVESVEVRHWGARLVTD